jgi:hypothetical protein
MTSLALQNKLVDLLSIEKHGALTRHLCNKIFLEKYNGLTMWPGTSPMRCTYYVLRQLCKQGKIVCDYPGHWRIAQHSTKNDSNV